MNDLCKSHIANFDCILLQFLLILLNYDMQNVSRTVDNNATSFYW